MHPNPRHSATIKNLQTFPYNSGPYLDLNMIPTKSLMNYAGFIISNFNLPVGSSNGGYTLGGSLPLPFNNFYASVIGSNSNEILTYP